MPIQSVAKDVVLDGIGGDVQERSFSVLRPGGMLIPFSQPPSENQAAQHKVSAVMLGINVFGQRGGLDSVLYAAPTDTPW